MLTPLALRGKPDSLIPSRFVSRFLKLGLWCEGGLALAAFAVGWLVGHSPAESLTWRASSMAIGLAAALPPLAFAIPSYGASWAPFVRLRRLLDEVLLPLFERSSIAELAVVAILAGVGEELLFRGLIQEGLDRNVGTLTALAVASVLFGLVHALTFTYGVVATLMGAYLGWLFVASENLLVPIVAHAAYDFALLVYVQRLGRRDGEATIDGDRADTKENDDPTHEGSDRRD